MNIPEFPPVRTSVARSGVLALAFVLTAALTLIAGPAEAVEGDESLCDDATPTKSGTSGADKLNGTLFADVIFGLAGNDTISGGGLGNDLLCGDADNDRLTGGLGHDRLIGGDGDDTLAGASGNDRLAGGGGKDTLGGGDASDVLTGGAGDDALDGGNGKDYLIGGSGMDTVVGGSGDDEIETFDGEADRIDCGPGKDVVKADTRDLINSNCEQVTAKKWISNLEISPTVWGYDVASSHTFTITNVGPQNGTPEVFLSWEFGGGNVHFTIEDNMCIDVVLKKGESCTVAVRFTPQGEAGTCVRLYYGGGQAGYAPPYARLYGAPYRDSYGFPSCPNYFS